MESDSAKGKAIMVLGTTSDAGKSLITMAICRMISDMGYTVCPFKAQNMSLNSKPTPDGHEISMIQTLQCMAARTEPTFRVNPILLKPIGDSKSQVVVNGKIFGHYDVNEYYDDFIPNHGFNILKESVDFLKKEFDFVVMEGAGSPAEINIYDKDIVNMGAAKAADADCILVTNMEWGGSFAYILGTIMLIPEEDRSRIKGFIFNNVKGSIEGIKESADDLEKLTGIQCLGVIPHIPNNLPNEDSEWFRDKDSIGNGRATIGLIKLPRIANFTDTDPLYKEDVTVKFVKDPKTLESCDAIIIPGTKNTGSDLKWMIDTGIADVIKSKAGKVPILGLCGGYQMLGKKLLDPRGFENPDEKIVDGLGLLNVVTQWGVQEKITCRNKGSCTVTDGKIDGYQVHVGRTESEEKHLFEIESGPEGSCREDMMIFGTYLHGVLEKSAFRRYFLSLIDSSFAEDPVYDYCADLDENIDFVTSEFMNNLDTDLFKKLFLKVIE